MNLDELRDVRNRERSMDSLQELRDTFYADVAEYIGELKAERDRLAREADDPFSAPEVSRLSDEIETAEKVAAAIYERRVGKVVKQASFAAADMPGAESGLTTEERDLYDDIVDRIRENKRRVMEALDGAEGEAVFDGAAADGAADGDPGERPDGVAGSSPGGVDAADLMGGDGAAADGTAAERADAGPASDEPDSDDEDGGSDAAGEDATAAAGERGDDREAAPAADGTARERIRVTADVGEILGVDERVYTLEADDVVELPTENATPLLERDAAERLE